MSATVRALTGYPWRHNSSANFAVLLDDQRNGDMDLPALPGRPAVPIPSPAGDLVLPLTFSRRRPFALAPAESHGPPVREWPGTIHRQVPHGDILPVGERRARHPRAQAMRVGL